MFWIGSRHAARILNCHRSQYLLHSIGENCVVKARFGQRDIPRGALEFFGMVQNGEDSLTESQRIILVLGSLVIDQHLLVQNYCGFTDIAGQNVTSGRKVERQLAGGSNLASEVVGLG